MAKLNIKVVTTEMLSPWIINKEAKSYPKRIFWEFSKNTLGSVFYYSKQEEIAGFILMSSFGCGPDSMTASIIQHYLKGVKDKPLLNLTIDEHTGEAGINTVWKLFMICLCEGWDKVKLTFLIWETCIYQLKVCWSI